MGLEDRDYYREKYKDTSKNENLTNFRKQPVNTPPGSDQSLWWSTQKPEKSNLKYLLYPIFTLAILWYGSNFLLDKLKSGKTILPESLIKLLPSTHQTSLSLIPGGVVLQADGNGHFRGTALINNIPMPFMIDTGATQTTIPVNLAIAARLPFGKSVQMNTAGGQVFDQMTHINSLKLGNAEIGNLNASINQHINEVLIGMNTLKYFI